MSYQPQIQCKWCKKTLTQEQVYNHLKAKKKKPNKKVFCGRSCSAKWRMSRKDFKEKFYTEERNQKISKATKKFMQSGHPVAIARIERIRTLNPMSNPKTRAKVSKTLKKMGHKPLVRWGNSMGPTKPQKLLIETLKKKFPQFVWELEHAVKLGKSQKGYPTNYKIDIAAPSLHLGIEVDGYSHKAIVRQKKDKKKDKKLTELGWTILRFTNQTILSSINIVISKIKSYCTI